MGTVDHTTAAIAPVIGPRRVGTFLPVTPRRPTGRTGVAPRHDTVDTRHRRRVPDPYRWLEDRRHPATRRWAAAQDARARETLDALPGRAALEREIARCLAAGEDGVGHRLGGHTMALRRHPGAEHPVLEVSDGGATRVLLDPLTLDPTGATVVDGWWPGPAGRRVAVATSDPGHASRLRLIDAATGELLEGPVERTALSAAAWLPGEHEVVWVRQDAADPTRRRAFRHHVGTDPTHDTPVDGEGLDAAGLYLGVRVAPDGRWLVVDAAAGTAPGDGLWVLDLAAPGARARRVLSPADGVRARAAVAADGRLWVVTTLDAPRGRLCVADPADPDPARWRELVGEDPATVLEAVRLVADVAVLVRSRAGVGELHRHDPTDGTALGPLPLPGAGVVTALGSGAAPCLEIGWSTPTTPTRVLHADVRRGTVTDPAGRDDGVRTEPIPGTRTLVTARPGDGPRPTVLTGYGGFSHVAGPEFSVLAAAWVAAGGVWVRAVLRGGGEDGAPGHDAGRGAHLLAGTDDLLAAADDLVAAGVTTGDRLALLGTSHGGLRVAQALVARPDAVAAVVAVSPLTDLLRSERLGLGWAWVEEYGHANDAVEHGHLLAGSPYHGVRAGSAYPRVLITASDADTRVDAGHARKLVAALDHAVHPVPAAHPAHAAGRAGQPPLLRRETDTGHGPRSVARTAAFAVDVLAFLADATGLVLPGDRT